MFFTVKCRLILDNKIFFQWLGNSIYHSVVIFFLWRFILGDGDVLNNGWVADNWLWGEWVYATVLLTVLLKTCLIIDTWVVLSYICVFGSFIAFFIIFPLVYITHFLIIVHDSWCYVVWRQISSISRTLQLEFGDVE